jgi:hypothetical protein
MKRIPIEDLSVGETFHFPDTSGFEGEWIVNRFDSESNMLYVVRTSDGAKLRVSLDVENFAFIHKKEDER